jgi:hypothetical protein
VLHNIASQILLFAAVAVVTALLYLRSVELHGALFAIELAGLTFIMMTLGRDLRPTLLG